jgi:hypothetical protein
MQAGRLAPAALVVFALLSAGANAGAGTVVCAGAGPLGDGTTADSNVPVRVINLSNVVAVGLQPPMAVKADGTVWAWGGGTGDPVRIAGLDNIVAIRGSEVDSHFKLALRADGTVWQWSAVEPLPSQVADPRDSTGFLTGVTAIANGQSYYALKSDGTVWAWGQNCQDAYCGLLGDGTTDDRPYPVQCLNLDHVTAIAADRSHAMALKADGTVWAWGSNRYGQLGDGTDIERLAPVQVFPGGGSSSPDAGAIGIAASAYTSYVLRADGTVWSCGENSNGQIGDGTTVSRSSWVRVLGLAGVYRIVSGPNAWITIALKSDGSAWGWGLNDHGHLGCGTNEEVQPLCRVRSADHFALDLLPGRIPADVLDGPPADLSFPAGYLGGVVDAATDVNQSCYLTTQAPLHVPAIDLALQSAGGRSVAVATVTVLDEFGAPVAGAFVSGHGTGLVTAPGSGITGEDGTVKLTSTAPRRPNETVTFVVDAVLKRGMFLDRQRSVLTQSTVR